jgi:hypothetical protein
MTKANWERVFLLAGCIVLILLLLAIPRNKVLYTSKDISRLVVTSTSLEIFEAQQVVVEIPTWTPTPLHWSSNTLDIKCNNLGFEGSPLRLCSEDVFTMELHVEMQITQSGKMLLYQEVPTYRVGQGITMPIVAPIEPCTGTIITVHYDWKTLGTPSPITGLVTETVKLDWRQVPTNVVVLLDDGTQWDGLRQGYLEKDGVLVTPNSDGYFEYRSFVWATDTPTPVPIPTSTPTPSPTPTPRWVVYLPVILK